MATIHDVAKLAAVSIKTVSRVINGEVGVREATRERVQQAIDKLQYTPHSGARLMRSSKSNLIGLISSAISTVSRDPAKAGLSSIHVVKGVQHECRAAGKTLLMIDTEPDAVDIQDHVDILLSHRVEGMLYVADYHRLIAPPRVHDIPCWLVNGYSTPTFPAVVPDDLWGQAQAVDYLVAQGHSKLAYVGLDVNLEAGRLRREGFLHAAHAAGIKSEQLHVQSGTQRGEKTPFSLLKTVLHGLLQQAHPPSVICFGNDQMALTAIPIIESLGLRMPEDVSIMGFDNDIAIALAARPKLTTVALPYQRMGQVAAKGLLQQLNGVNAEVDYPLKIRGEVVERDSVKNRNETRI